MATPKRHFLGLITTPCSLRRSKTRRTYCRCSSEVVLAIRRLSIRVAEVEATQNLVNETLKRLRCVSEIEWHPYKFE